MKTTHLSYTRFLHDVEKSPKIINLANSEITSLSEVCTSLAFIPVFTFVSNVF